VAAAIRDEYLSKQKKRAEAVVRAVRDRCRAAGITPPAANTVRARVRRVRADKAARAREGSGSAAARRLTPVVGQTPPAPKSMAVLQEDHTPVDLILVDETWRKPIGRPWLSVAIDTYSRCIAGLHLSYEAPSATVAGLCLAHAALDKAAYLNTHSDQRRTLLLELTRGSKPRPKSPSDNPPAPRSLSCCHYVHGFRTPTHYSCRDPNGTKISTGDLARTNEMAFCYAQRNKQ